MTESIHKLIEAISNLPRPIDPLDLNILLAPYAKLASLEPQDEAQAQMIILHDISIALGHTLTALITKKNDAEQMRIDDSKYTQDLARLSQHHCQLKAELDNKDDVLAHLYDNISQEFSNSLMSNSKAQLEKPFFRSTEEDYKSVVGYYAALNQELTRIQLPEWQLQLIQLKTNVNASVSALTMLNFNCSASDSEERCISLMNMIDNRLCELMVLKEEIVVLSNKFYDHLSEEVRRQKLEEIQQQKLLATLELAKLQTELQKSVLDSDTQKQLVQEFEKAIDREALIISYENKIDKAVSYIDPIAWSDYFFNRQYETDQKKHKLSVEFLTLLYQKEKMQAMDNKFSQAKQRLECYPTSSLTSNEDTNKELHAQATTLINKLPLGWLDHYKLLASSTSIDFLFTLLDNIPYLDLKITHLKQGIEHLDALILANKQLTQHRAAHDLPEAQDYLLQSIPVLQAQRDALASQQSLCQTLNQQRALCQSYLDKINHYAAVGERSREISTQIKIIDNWLSMPRINIEEINNSILQLKQDITDKAHQVVDYLLKAKIADVDVEILPALETPRILPLENNLVTVATPIENVQVLGMEDRSDNNSPVLELHTVFNQLSAPIQNIPKSPKSQPNAVLKEDESPLLISKPLVIPIATHSSPAHKEESPKLDNHQSTLKTTQLRKIKSLSKNKQNIEKSIQPIKRAALNITLPLPVIQQTHSVILWPPLHKQILEKQPLDLLQWYEELSETIVKVAKKTGYKPSLVHFMRDLHWSLEHIEGSSVMYAYKNLCPNPKENLQKLLDLKPKFATLEMDTDHKTIESYPIELHPLFKQYTHLKEKYPTEAEVLLHGINVLAQVYQNKSLGPISSLHLDPFYQPLKQHRGLVKVWVLFEDFCRLIVAQLTGQYESDYSKKPYFFQTRSIKLLEQAELAINATSKLSGG